MTCNRVDARVEMGEWVSSADRNPDEPVDALVHEADETYRIAKWSGRDWWSMTSGGSVRVRVTRWAELKIVKEPG